MTDFIPKEAGTPIREPAVANLMIDSADSPLTNGFRTNPWNFVIAQKESILNGFFTRLATTEVVLEWNVPNISAANGNVTLTFTVSGGATTTITLPDGFYTTYQLITSFIDKANAAQAAVTFKLEATTDNTGPPGFFVSAATGSPNVAFTSTTLLSQLGIVPTSYATAWYLTNVDLRYYRYLDFVSSLLTGNQNVKDSSTSAFKRNVLCRWYMAYDNPVALDLGGWPIFMGYEPFALRRMFSPAKQIRWQPNMPIGQLDFQVYGISYAGAGSLVVSPAYDSRSNWLMTIQVSET